MHDAGLFATLSGGRPASRPWWRWPALAMLLATVFLAGGATVHQDAATALTPALRGSRPPLLQQSLPVNFHIHGDATVIYDYSSAAGQKELADCHMDMVPRWDLILDGTIDTVEQTLKGGFTLTNDTRAKLADWQKWDLTTAQCGPDMHGLTSCNAGCGPNWITYRYVTNTGLNGPLLPGDQFITSGRNDFHGSYDAQGNFTLVGRTAFFAHELFLDCFNEQTGVATPCDTALGIPTSPVPPEIGAPRNARNATFYGGNHDVVITGKIAFTEGGVSMRGNMNLPESLWAECCIVQDPLFLSEKNHVRIEGEAVANPAGTTGATLPPPPSTDTPVPPQGLRPPSGQ
jgi:hypothetical protein